MPDFTLEEECAKEYGGDVCGLDEVGRAPLAGPVVAACVFIPPGKRDLKIWRQVDDSKLLKAQTRRDMMDEIKAHCLWGIAECCPREIEQMNIVQASLEAMRRAYQMMGQVCSLALIDGNQKPSFPCSVLTVVKGDQKSVSIAAASIIAKVYRDGLMARLAQDHPHYGWERNVGYPTPEHLKAIDAHGLTDHHRKTFAPVRNFLEIGTVQRQLKFV